MPARAKAAPPTAANNDVELDILASTQVDGATTIADTVIATIAGIAAREVPGVYKLGRGRFSAALDRLRGAHEPAVGVQVEVGRREVALDIDLIAEYGVDLHATAAAVRALIAQRIGEMTHLVVKEANITIVDIHLEASAEPPPKARVE